MRLFLYTSVRSVRRPFCLGMTLCFLVLSIGVFAFAQAGDYQVLKSKDVEILFSPALAETAQITAQRIPKIKKDLEDLFHWDFLFKPTVILMNHEERFRRMAGSPLIVGFAVTNKNLIVIDCTKIENPLVLNDILKHELSHLLLHAHIRQVRIPRWLDEGVAQWVSNGVMDILENQKEALLPKAAFADRVIPLAKLSKGFPREAKGLRLSYEESRSFVDYLIKTYGKEALFEILNRMKEGTPLRKAFSQVLGTPLFKVEDNWRGSLKETVAWFAHLSFYLYEILFALGGLIVVYGFIRLWKKKRAYMDEA